MSEIHAHVVLIGNVHGAGVGTPGPAGVPGQGILPDYVTATHEPTGFEDRTTTILSFNTNTRVFTIAPEGSSFSYWQNGVKKTVTGSATVTVSASTGLNFIYFNTSGVLTASQTAWDMKSGVVPVATVYRNFSTTAYAVGDERHGLRDLEWHDWAHKTVGPRFDQAFGGGVASFTNTTFAISRYKIMDEDIAHDTLAAVTAARLWYRIDSTQWTQVTSYYPYYLSGGAIYYDSNGVLLAVPAGRYVCNYIYGSNDRDPWYAYVVVGQTVHTTLAAARGEALPTSLPMSQELKLLYKVIYQNAAGTPTFIEAADYRAASGLPGGQTIATNAAQVVFAPSGDIAATNVQTAIEELDTEKLAASGGEISAYTEDESALTHTAGAVTTNMTTCPNVLTIDADADIVWTLTNLVTKKPVTLEMYHNTAARTLTINGSAVTLNGEAGETDYITIKYNGTELHVFVAGVPDVVI